MEWVKKHKVLTVVLVVVGLAVLAGAFGSESTTTNQTNETNTDTSTNEEKNENQVSATAKVGEPARDGKFEFTVNKVNCGKKELGNEYLNTKAQGEFCLLNVDVKNIGDEPQTLFTDNQYAYNAEGQKYSADSEASIYLDEAQNTIYEEINPGNSVSGVIVFDVPKNTKLVKVELHDSALSGGVEVSLE